MFLFSIIKEGKISYLFGTFHTLPLEKLPNFYQEFILARKTIVLESHFPTSSKAEKLKNIIDAGLLKNMNALEDEVNNYNFISNNIIKEAVEALIIEREFPFTINDLNDKGIFILYLQTIGNNGMDDVIKDLALKAGRKVLGLEEVTTTLKAIDYFYSNALQIIENINSFDELFSSFYLNGLLSREFLELSDEIHKDRTLKWMPILKNIHNNENDVIFCVGLGHLFKEYGILNLLLEDGFNLLKMNFENQGEPFSSDDLKMMEQQAPYNDLKYLKHPLNFSKEEIDQILGYAESIKDEEVFNRVKEMLETIDQISFNNNIANEVESMSLIGDENIITYYR